MQELLDGQDCSKERLVFLQMPINHSISIKNISIVSESCISSSSKYWDFCFSIHLEKVERQPQGLKSQQGCETATQKFHDHTLIPWEKDDWNCRCVPCWLKGRCSISGLRDSEREERKPLFWADSKTFAFVQSTSWGCWDPLIGGSLLKETTAGEAPDTQWQLFSAPCVFLHPSEHWAWTEFICRERENGTSYKILQKESSVISSPRRNTRCWMLLWKVQSFSRKNKDSSCWNLAPRYRSAEQNMDPREMDGLWALELLVFASPLPNCRQLNSKE